MKNVIGQAWLVILLSLCFGGALAGVQLVLEERIAQNKLAETMAQIPLLVPGAQEGRPDTVMGRTVYRALGTDGPAGWVIASSGPGFADRIELLLGLNADATSLTGLYVFGQKETPGLGNKIVEADWRDQFVGKSLLQRLTVIKGGARGSNSIDALTGATISSESVCDIVNQTMSQLREELAARQKGGK